MAQIISVVQINVNLNHSSSYQQMTKTELQKSTINYLHRRAEDRKCNHA